MNLVPSVSTKVSFVEFLNILIPVSFSFNSKRSRIGKKKYTRKYMQN